MPGLPQRDVQFSTSSYPSSRSSSAKAKGIWSKNRDDLTFDELQKFWSGLSPEARQELLRIDKHTLLEQARKNLYCSRCNGLLLEGFSQIVMYGKSLQQEGAASAGQIVNGISAASKNQNDSRSNTMPMSYHDDSQDPSVHPWGGLATTRDGILTLLDCFLDSKSLKGLQKVFDSARARERERELLYPDACGGGGRGWISLGMASYGRGHGTRETCALHTARLSCDTLVDFWSALGDETRQSLLRMKEEDFMERLMYRFDSKRFCRDCRRNVIREFKELKELKRMRREPRCTSWFCAPDTAFEYEVSDDTVRADWHQSFNDGTDTYTHFEWAVGTAAGISDILGFEDAGTTGCVQMNGLDLGGLSECFITLRAWKPDGQFETFSVKAHAMKGQPCVHRRLIVGDGFVTILKGDSIRRFFEHAEEAEEEEDDDSMDKDGNELDGEGSRPQKHAKSPELAREFLLDAATVIFKEQVEKAFREGTARQNAHSIFVCLALKLLEERVHVACKEISTLEKQSKLLEEEEKEKREEEKRKERRRTKEKEKKLRKKEKFKGKEQDREKENVESNQVICVSKTSEEEESSSSVHEEPTNNTEDSNSETRDIALGRPLSPGIQDEQSSNGYFTAKTHNLEDDTLQHIRNFGDEDLNGRDSNGLFIIEQSKSSRRKLRLRKESQLDPASKLCDRRRYAVGNDSCVLFDESEPRSHSGCMGNPSKAINGVSKQIITNLVKSNSRNCGPKFNEKFHHSDNRMYDRYDSNSCNCNVNSDYRAKNGSHISAIRSGRVIKTVSKSESVSDVSRPYRNNKYIHGSYFPDRAGIPKAKPICGNIPPSRDLIHVKKVWEPMDSRKKYSRSNSDSDVPLRSSTSEVYEFEGKSRGDGIGYREVNNLLESSGELSSYELYGEGHKDNNGNESRHKDLGAHERCKNGSDLGTPDSIMNSTSSSDNCSSCLSEGDSSSASSSTQNAESWSTSDSEDASPQSEGKETSVSVLNGFQKSPDAGSPVSLCALGVNPQADSPIKNLHTPNSGRIKVDMGSQQHHMIPPMHSQGIHLPVFPAPPTMAYYHQNPASWSATPATGLVQFPPTNHYLFPSPLGYGVSTNQPSHFPMQYSSIQPLTSSIFNMGQVPVYQPVNKAHGVISNEQTKNCNVERPVLNVRAPPTAPPTVLSHSDNGRMGRSSNLNDESKNFSLFLSGGPTSMTTESNLKKEFLEDFSSNNSPRDLPSQDNLSCTRKETTIEEYSLFATSNGTRLFSFF